ncbi:DUF4159 domain-containing protein [Spirulina sp. 06S082]|uniref:DUF4159 domain-containing protein n=1 Tax=Spirulina sp. 06S082 TaxID=3110248 RepID=UPI002B20EE78|nr:DUF4159 domain-containing protein [Spirulina sp. 06S082]MEA5469654.1 DUF4159 domain-containing protein [Spirulina sp. 06S082]
MTQFWSPPPRQPLKRLQVSDGLLMNAKRWRLAHQYHRLRQNLHYQSLNQSGIVEGLGISTIDPPEEIRSQYRDRRWLQIQPGIAIDIFGNPIIVSQAIEFRLASENRSPKPLEVYLVIRYVDPDSLGHKQSGDLVEETFRIDEKTDAPTEADVELCRITLPAHTETGVILPVELQPAVNVFQPQPCQPNLLYRQMARSHPQVLIEVAGIRHASTSPESEEKFAQFNALLEAAPGLAPTLCGRNSLESIRPILSPQTDTLGLEYREDALGLEKYHLLYWPVSGDPPLTEAEEFALRDYLQSGGTILVDAIEEPPDLVEVLKMQQELYSAIAASEQDSDLIASQPELIAELNALQLELSSRVSQVFPNLEILAQYSGETLESLIGLDRPLQRQPFPFSALPIIQHKSTYLAVGGGVILSIGNLSQAWGINKNRVLSRETLRSAQELGVNMLYFAWRRKQLIQWQMALSNIEITPENLSTAAAETASHPFDLSKKP